MYSMNNYTLTVQDKHLIKTIKDYGIKDRYKKRKKMRISHLTVPFTQLMALCDAGYVWIYQNYTMVILTEKATNL